MRWIELELEEIKAFARLLDERAPNTCRALWDALPFEDMVTHSRWSRGRLHTHNHPKLDIDSTKYPFIENPSVYQAPGDVSVWPLNNEFTISYSPGSFAWMHQLWIVTQVARIEGEFGEFAKKIERMQFEGAKKLVVRRFAGDKPPVPPIAVQGPKIKIECDGKTWIAELYTDRVPKLCNAILNSLPLEAPVTNLHSSGMMFHFWVKDKVKNVPEEIETGRERWPVEYQGEEIGGTAVAFYDPREMRFNLPGDLLFGADEGIGIVHGQAQVTARLGHGTGVTGQAAQQKIGRIVEGDIEDMRDLGDRMEWEGTKIMRMTLV